MPCNNNDLLQDKPSSFRFIVAPRNSKSTNSVIYPRPGLDSAPLTKGHRMQSWISLSPGVSQTFNKESIVIGAERCARGVGEEDVTHNLEPASESKACRP